LTDEEVDEIEVLCLSVVFRHEDDADRLEAERENVAQKFYD
jgi:hypothetical protein